MISPWKKNASLLYNLCLERKNVMVAAWYVVRREKLLRCCMIGPKLCKIVGCCMICPKLCKILLYHALYRWRPIMKCKHSRFRTIHRVRFRKKLLKYQLLFTFLRKNNNSLLFYLVEVEIAIFTFYFYSSVF